MTVITQFDPSDTAASELVVTVLADRLETPPTELQPPLYESIDPELLDRLVDHGSARTQITFTHLDHEIVVDSDGLVQLTGEPPQAEEHAS